MSFGTPRSRYQSRRSWHQYSYHFADSAGGTKNSISICSNSRVRKIQFCGVISLRKLLPTCAIPNGGFLRVELSTLEKLTNIPCAVSGLRYATAPASSTGPALVLNIRLNWRGSVNVPCLPQLGQVFGSSSLSRRKRFLQLVQSTSGSLKLARWPEASQIWGGPRIAASISTTSSRCWTMRRIHDSRILRSSNDPSGP